METKRIFQLIEERREELFSLLSSFVKINSENFSYKGNEEELARYKDLPLPAVVSIPGQGGSTGYGMNNIRSAVERAVGADILFKE